MASAASLMGQAQRMLQQLRLSFDNLVDAELTLFDRTYDRLFYLEHPFREVRDIYARRKADILAGALVAREQMGGGFGGEFPEGGQFGMVLPRAAFFGIGDDWEDASPFTTGSPQNWIHSGTSLLGGSAGNPIRIEENAVHVIVAVGSLHPSPKIESIPIKLGGNDYPPLITSTVWKQAAQAGGLAVKELERPIILKERDTFLAKVFISSTFGSSAADYPFLIGASFIAEEALRAYDADDVVASATKIVSAT